MVNAEAGKFYQRYDEYKGLVEKLLKCRELSDPKIEQPRPHPNLNEPPFGLTDKTQQSQSKISWREVNQMTEQKVNQLRLRLVDVTLYQSHQEADRARMISGTVNPVIQELMM